MPDLGSQHLSLFAFWGGLGLTLIVIYQADFCIWGSPILNGVILDVEAAVVAYCAQPGHGTRVMPPGTITGAQVSFALTPRHCFISLHGPQFMRTSAYIQITGFLNQTGIGVKFTDSGGELDPHAADLVRTCNYHCHI